MTISNKNYRKGYEFERRIKKLFEKHGWLVIRSGRSLGVADLVCFKDGMALFLQLKATKKDVLYYNEKMRPEIQGFPFRLVVRFDRKKTVVVEPKKKITPEDGLEIKRFLEVVDSAYETFFGYLEPDEEESTRYIA